MGQDGSIRAWWPNADDGSLPQSKVEEAKMGSGAEPKPISASRTATLQMFLERGEALMTAQVGWEKLTLLVDSGASDTVVPLNVCTAAQLHKTGKVGIEYEIANGGSLENLGERRCLMMIEDSQAMMRIVFQCADVHKPLLSVSRLADLDITASSAKEADS